MSCFLSEFLIPEGGGGLPWPGCQYCRRTDCPFAYGQALRSAACRGRASARLLTAKADQLREAVSRAGDICRLLDADRDLERALSYALHSEMALIDTLRVQTAERSP